jgi:hypothetical protein
MKDAFKSGYLKLSGRILRYLRTGHMGRHSKIIPGIFWEVYDPDSDSDSRCPSFMLRTIGIHRPVANGIYFKLEFDNFNANN